jgi:hypothetical protein
MIAMITLAFIVPIALASLLLLLAMAAAVPSAFGRPDDAAGQPGDRENQSCCCHRECPPHDAAAVVSLLKVGRHRALLTTRTPRVQGLSP